MTPGEKFDTATFTSALALGIFALIVGASGVVYGVVQIARGLSEWVVGR